MSLNTSQLTVRKVTCFAFIAFLIAEIYILTKSASDLSSEVAFKQNAIAHRALVLQKDRYGEPETESRITDDVFLIYRVGEKQYTKSWNHFRLGMKAGEMINIFYHPADPNHLITEYTIADDVSLLVIHGTVFIIVALLLFRISGPYPPKKQRYLSYQRTLKQYPHKLIDEEAAQYKFKYRAKQEHRGDDFFATLK